MSSPQNNQIQGCVIEPKHEQDEVLWLRLGFTGTGTGTSTSTLNAVNPTSDPTADGVTAAAGVLDNAIPIGHATEGTSPADTSTLVRAEPPNPQHARLYQQCLDDDTTSTAGVCSTAADASIAGTSPADTSTLVRAEPPNPQHARLYQQCLDDGTTITAGVRSTAADASIASSTPTTITPVDDGTTITAGVRSTAADASIASSTPTTITPRVYSTAADASIADVVHHGTDPTNTVMLNNTIQTGVATEAEGTSREPTAAITKLQYARLYQQYLDNDGDTTITVGFGSMAADASIARSLPTTVTAGVDSTSAGASVAAASGSRASAPRRGSLLRSLGRFAVVAVFALFLSSPDHTLVSTGDEDSLLAVGVQYVSTYVRSSVHQRVRRRLHSSLDPVLSRLPTWFIRQLPTDVVPPEQISRLSLVEIASLPTTYIAEQPLSIIAQLPPESVARLPTTVIAQLPVSSIRQLHLSPIRWLGVGVHIWRGLLLSVSDYSVSHLPAWVPAPFTAWVLRLSLTAGSLLFFSFIIRQLLYRIFGLLRRVRRRLRRDSRQP